MLQIETIINNYDNTGVISGKIIHVYKGGRKGVTATVGDSVLIASQKTDYRKIQKKKITRAVVVKTKKNVKRINGHYIKFKDSGVITLQEKDTFKATAIKGPISAELRFNTIAGIVTAVKSTL